MDFIPGHSFRAKTNAIVRRIRQRAGNISQSLPQVHFPSANLPLQIPPYFLSPHPKTPGFTSTIKRWQCLGGFVSLYFPTQRYLHGAFPCRQNRYRDWGRFWCVCVAIGSVVNPLLIDPAGINFSFAKTLLFKGCNVLFADLALRPEAQEAVSNHSRTSQTSPKAVFQQTDVRDWQHLRRMFHVAEKEFGDIDVVCPGAGVYEPVGQWT